MKLKEILSILPIYELKNVSSDTTIQGVKMDDREVSKGDLFVCIKGFTVDGHDFAENALKRGATVIICERDIGVEDAPMVIVPNTTRALALIANKYFRYPTSSLTLVGITGTNGKTTTTYLLEKIFQKLKRKTGIIGTIQLKIGNESKPIVNTTPDALQLQNYFHQMVQENVDIAFMEVSSHALDLGRTFGCDFDVAVFTNLSQDHLDYHKTMENYLAAKTLLFTGLGNSYSDQQKFAILNADDPHSETIIKQTMQPIVTYGIHNDAHIMAKEITYSLTNTTFTVSTPKGDIKINSKLNGMFNVYNMLAAISVSYVQNVPLSVIKEALEEVNGVDGRFERVDVGQDYAVIVDYAHTPDSLENVLQTIKEFANRKIYVVVGSGGDRDRTKRPLMAQVALNYSDWTIFTSDNPRTEDPKQILQDMTRGIKGDHYEVIENRKEAIERAIELASSGDVILIAGKGHETYQEINGVRYDFDDRLVAKNAIEKKGI